MKSRLIAAIVLGITATTAAIAADLPQGQGGYAPAAVASPAVGYNWNGFYAGVNAGYGWGSFKKGSANLFKNPTGGTVGAQAGFNYQSGNLFVGLEADVYWSAIRAKRSFAGPVIARGDIDWGGSLRARAGFAADRALVYLTGGVAMATIDTRVNDSVLGVFSSSDTRGGWVLGAGIEYAFTNHISVKTEYLYTSYASKIILAAPYRTSSKLTSSILRAGVNYHF